MLYSITIKKSAVKELEHLPGNIIKKVTQQIQHLAHSPRPPGSKKLQGASENLWRIRIGNYRVVYLIEDIIKIIDIRKIGHRKIYTDNKIFALLMIWKMNFSKRFMEKGTCI